MWTKKLSLVFEPTLGSQQYFLLYGLQGSEAEHKVRFMKKANNQIIFEFIPFSSFRRSKIKCFYKSLKLMCVKTHLLKKMIRLNPSWIRELFIQVVEQNQVF